MSAARVLVLVTLGASLGVPLAAADRSRPLRLDVGGSFGTSSARSADTRHLTQFVEEGRIDTSYVAAAGPGFEAGALYRFSRHLGMAGGVTFVRRGQTGSYSASLPHPLYFGRPRQVSGDVTGLAHRETGVHVDIVGSASRGRLDVHVFAGPSWLRVRSDFVNDVTYTQSYPYDTVEVTGTPLQAFEGDAFGFNVGGGLDYRLGAGFGIGAGLRFTRATVLLAPPSGDAVHVKGGGLQVGLGARLYF